jgi:hypothetical protein
MDLRAISEGTALRNGHRFFIVFQEGFNQASLMT